MRWIFLRLFFFSTRNWFCCRRRDVFRCGCLRDFFPFKEWQFNVSILFNFDTNLLILFSHFFVLPFSRKYFVFVSFLCTVDVSIFEWRCHRTLKIKKLRHFWYTLNALCIQFVSALPLNDRWRTSKNVSFLFIFYFFQNSIRKCRSFLFYTI